MPPLPMPPLPGHAQKKNVEAQSLAPQRETASIENKTNCLHSRINKANREQANIQVNSIY